MDLQKNRVNRSIRLLTLVLDFSRCQPPRNSSQYAHIIFNSYLIVTCCRLFWWTYWWVFWTAIDHLLPLFQKHSFASTNDSFMAALKSLHPIWILIYLTSRVYFVLAITKRFFEIGNTYMLRTYSKLVRQSETFQYMFWPPNWCCNQQILRELEHLRR